MEIHFSYTDIVALTTCVFFIVKWFDVFLMLKYASLNVAYTVNNMSFACALTHLLDNVVLFADDKRLFFTISFRLFWWPIYCNYDHCVSNTRYLTVVFFCHDWLMRKDRVSLSFLSTLSWVPQRIIHAYIETSSLICLLIPFFMIVIPAH